MQEVDRARARCVGKEVWTLTPDSQGCIPGHASLDLEKSLSFYLPGSATTPMLVWVPCFSGYNRLLVGNEVIAEKEGKGLGHLALHF